MLPEPIITVTLSDLELGGASPFSIDPSPLVLEKMQNSYYVIFALSSAIPGAQLIAAGQTTPTARPPHVMETVRSDGTLLITFDRPLDQLVTNLYKYEVAVLLPNGTILVSPDPEIEIPPGP